jgi:murein DD-endopeptidase MepM/ murein hydrolase activator NlpD
VDQGKSRINYRHAGEPEQIELGNDPPLSVDGETGGLIDRRRVSVQWFSGTILTGLCGAALMGGAVFASLDGESTFAAIPERGDAALRGGVTGKEAALARKGDRLLPIAEPAVTRQIIRVSTMNRAGEREVVRVLPHVLVAGNLSLTATELSANIPPFNPQRLMAEAAADETEIPGGLAGAEPDAEVSFVTRDLNAVLPRARIAATVPVNDILADVRQVANWASGGAVRHTLASADPNGMRLAYAPEGRTDPYAGFETRIVPENITMLPKTAARATGGSNASERAVTVKKGETIGSILTDLGANENEVKAILAVLGNHGRPGGIQEGHKLRILFSPTTALGTRMQPVRVIVMGDAGREAVAALSDTGRYVAVDVDNVETEVTENREEEDDENGSSVRLYQSVYETGLRNNVPRSVIDDIIRVYSFDVDFQRRVQPGDSFEVLFVGEDETANGDNNENKDAKPDVLFATLTVGGETRKYYRYRTDDDGIVDYYDESGKSAKKFLVRKPVAAGAMRSGFGMRRHPILKYSKMHTGVDWSAPFGTKIFASGNGVVVKAKWEGGYGKYIRIRHANGYETAYGHMSAFARNIQPGTTVRQGQLIGYVGSTGLSTGAHLHYEILVNQRFVNPMRIRLPRGRSLAGRILNGFDQERDRIEKLMTRASSRPVRTTHLQQQ